MRSELCALAARSPQGLAFRADLFHLTLKAGVLCASERWGLETFGEVCQLLPEVLSFFFSSCRSALYSYLKRLCRLGIFFFFKGE